VCNDYGGSRHNLNVCKVPDNTAQHSTSRPLSHFLNLYSSISTWTQLHTENSTLIRTFEQLLHHTDRSNHAQSVFCQQACSFTVAAHLNINVNTEIRSSTRLLERSAEFRINVYCAFSWRDFTLFTSLCRKRVKDLDV
jgi:hypothetical protein